jgi:type IV secretory pathway protease TraF
MEILQMKAFVAAGALAALVMTTPAIAQSNNSSDQAMGSFALAQSTGPIYSDGTLAATHPHDVIADGTVVGRDPDPNIRFQLWREYHSSRGGGGE